MTYGWFGRVCKQRKKKFNDENLFFVPELALESIFEIRFPMAKKKAPPARRAKTEERGVRMYVE
jgi:hypothetical protein